MSNVGELYLYIFDYDVYVIEEYVH